MKHLHLAAASVVACALVAASLPAAAGARSHRPHRPPFHAVRAPFAAPRAHAFGWPATAPDDPMFASQTELTVTGITTAWRTTTGDGSVIVAVLDTGIAAGHPELAGQLVDGYNAITRTPTSAPDFGAVADGHGHGTHVSGTIAARTDNGVGIAGEAPGVRIMPVKVLGDNGSGSFDDIMTGISWAVAHGADVISMSLGGGMSSSAAAWYQPFIDAAWGAGVNIVAAAGNTGSTSVQYPCAFAHVTCAASSSKSGLAISTFSTHNAHVDITAPGESITSTVPPAGYAILNGTSMATPQVAGAIALLRSIHPGAAPDELEARVLTTAVERGTTGRDSYWGHGLLDAAAAIGAPAAPRLVSSTPSDGATGIARDATITATFDARIVNLTAKTFTVTVTGRRTAVRGALTWDDPSRTVRFTPAGLLAAGTSYTVTAAGLSSGGLPLRTSFAFTTVADATAPTLVTRLPASGARLVPVTTAIAWTVSEDLRAGDPAAATSVAIGRTPVAVSATWDPATRTLTLVPQAPLPPRARVTVSIAAGLKDLAGNPLKAVRWTFTTAP